MTLIVWWKYIHLKGKLKFRSGKGKQICDLKELDNCFAWVAIRTTDKILITEDSHFNGDVKKALSRKGVSVWCVAKGCATLQANYP